ncbi:MAG: glycoside hydrolase family 3 N-terminal domain-containing protein [Anaerolineales bacterium]
MRLVARLVLGCAILLSLVGFAPKAASVRPEVETPAGSSAERVSWLMQHMSVEQKVGQLLLVYFEGPALSPELGTLLRDCHAGGILLFSAAGNITSVEQVADLIAQAQQEATGQPGGVPLFVAVDQEGGAVARLRDGVAVVPSQMGVAAGGSVEKASALYRINAQQLAAMGINMNLAPVLDVNTNPANPVIGTRSFGSDAAQVAAYGRAAIEAIQATGVVATAKHFPGHGDTAVDSHVGLPVVEHGRERLEAVELAPFRAAIAADVDAIMTAHLLVPAIDDDPTRPATLSPKVLTELLRGELGYQGLIVSDALGMGALAQHYTLPDAAVLAVQAGVDVLTFGDAGTSWAQDEVAVYQRLLQAVGTGEISAQRLDDAVRRILMTKDRRGILDWSPTPEALRDTVGNAGQSALAAMAYDDSITLLRDDAGLVPVAASDRLLVLTRQNPTLWSVALAGHPGEVRVLYMPADPSTEYIAQAITAAATADKVIIATYAANSHPAQAQLIQALAAYPRVVISLSGPYDLQTLAISDPAPGHSSSLLVAYDSTEGSVRALSRALDGAIPPQGRLPVEVEGLYPLGAGFIP